MLAFDVFVVFIALICSTAFKDHIARGSHFPILSINGCRLHAGNCSWRINPRLFPLRQIPVHPGTHLHSGDPEHLLAGGT